MSGRSHGLWAITHDDNSALQVPSTPDDWRLWVGGTAIRNWLLKDTLVDWLEEYGRANGFRSDCQAEGYDPRSDFSEFIFRKASAFEAAATAHLNTFISVTTIGRRDDEGCRLPSAEDTVRAMEAGVTAISHAVLRDPENRTYGVADLLIRSDELRRLFPDALSAEEAVEPATSLLGARWHYRVVDIKFKGLDLLVNGDLGNGGSDRAYKGHLFICNRALGRIQGFLAPASYVIGRSWAQRVKKETVRGAGCLERLGKVVHDGNLAKDVQEAVEWVRRLRQHGSTWTILPEPTVAELRPNMGADGGAWTGAKKEIAAALQELTSLWYVGIDKRRHANAIGVYRWSDPRCTAAALGVSGEKRGPVLQAILDINRSNGPAVCSKLVAAGSPEWRDPSRLEFYVDFETVNDMDDDFTRIPDRGGQPMIFMIGCGHLEGGRWQFRCFTVDRLTEACEAAILNDWVAHMRSVRARLGTDGANPLVIHWSKAETSNIRDAYNAAIRRHPTHAAAWSTPHWFDFLTDVVRAEPVVVRGAWGFGLKNIAQAMWQHGLIQTCWDDGPTDGLGAMVGAWWCAKEAAKRGVPLIAVDLMSPNVQMRPLRNV